MKDCNLYVNSEDNCKQHVAIIPPCSTHYFSVHIRSNSDNLDLKHGAQYSQMPMGSEFNFSLIASVTEDLIDCF